MIKSRRLFAKLPYLAFESYTQLQMSIYNSYLQGIFKSIIQFHYGSLVATAIAVVWRTEYGDNISIMTPVVSLIGGGRV